MKIIITLLLVFTSSVAMAGEWKVVCKADEITGKHWGRVYTNVGNWRINYHLYESRAGLISFQSSFFHSPRATLEVYRSGHTQWEFYTDIRYFPSNKVVNFRWVNEKSSGYFRGGPSGYTRNDIEYALVTDDFLENNYFKMRVPIGVNTGSTVVTVNLIGFTAAINKLKRSSCGKNAEMHPFAIIPFGD